MNFLDEMNEFGVLENKESNSLIIYADDQFVNQQQMKMHFKDIGIENRLVMFQNGKEVVDFFDEMLNSMENRA